MGAARVGIIGAGAIFEAQHEAAWKEIAEAQLWAVCDADEQRARKTAQRVGAEYVYTDYREMLRKHPELDMVDICTPNAYHAEIAVAALEAGKHVFCEKPDAVKPEDALRMELAAAASGRTLMVMRNNRFRPESSYLKRFIDEGHMGEIYTGRCGWIRSRGIPGKGGWFTTKALSGGGPLIDLGVHYLDLAMWLMGDPEPVAVTGATYAKFTDTTASDSEHSRFGNRVIGGTFDVEDLATAFIRFAGGATLQLECSWASNIEEEMNFVELRGTKAGCSFKKGELKLFGEVAGAVTDMTPRLPKKQRAGGGGHSANIRHFLDCALRGIRPLYTPGDGTRMIRILDAIYESARIGREVRLDGDA